MNIRKLIFEGEGVSLDFKKTITSCEKIARTMVSFANNKGGRLLIGVADDGTIKGVKSDDEERYMITRAAHLFAKPALEPIFEEVYFSYLIGYKKQKSFYLLFLRTYIPLFFQHQCSSFLLFLNY